MDKDQKWFVMAGVLNLFVGGYIVSEVLHKWNKKKKQDESNRKNSFKQEVINQLQKPNRKLSFGDNQKIQTDMHQKRVIKIVFTGGPCAGKTTSMAFCAELLRERGFRVYVVPEAATNIALGGGMINVGNYNPEQQIIFQSSLMKMQINLEDRFSEIAQIMETDQPAILLCDRGVMDGQAYIDQKLWQILIDEMGFNAVQLRDNRYDAVIHLVTAANGADKYYNLDNTARYETSLEIAVEVDQKLQQAWHGHPYWILIDNQNDFAQKMKRVGEGVLHLVGQPSLLTFYKKFLLKSSNFQVSQGIQQQQFFIEDTFIANSLEFHERRIRMRGQNDSYLYVLFETKQQNGKLIETKRRIRSRDYLALYENRDKERQTIKKTKTIFVWNKIVYSIESFNISGQEFVLAILQTEEKQNDKLVLPEFLKSQILREITDDINYFPISVSKIGWQIPQEDKALMEQHTN